MLRGENDIYPKTESSMKRFLTIEDRYMRSFDEATPFIDFEDTFADFHAERTGLTYEEGVGFLQHYGFPTGLFDLSPSIDNARFFACHGSEDKPVGVIGVFPREGVQAHFEVTDLSKHPFALRPRRQSAYAARAPAGIIDLKSDLCSAITGAKWYSFNKSEIDHDFVKNHLDWTYPSENELTSFFSDHFFQYFREHWVQDESSKAGKFVIEKLNAIVQLYSHD